MVGHLHRSIRVRIESLEEIEYGIFWDSDRAYRRCNHYLCRMDYQPLTSAGPYQDLVVQFLADLMSATTNAPTPHAFQHIVQTFCDALQPWLDPADGPACPRAVFPILEDCTFDEEAECISVRFSPEGEALFRAWVRRHAAAPRCAVHHC